MRMLTEPQLLEIARDQKRILRLLLLGVVVVISTFWVPAGGTSRMLLLTACGLIGVIAVVSVYRLAKVIEVAWPWLYAGCAYIPYLGTLTLLVLNLEATAALKQTFSKGR